MPKTYEYKVVADQDHRNVPLEDTINQHAIDGWRLINTVQTLESIKFIFERETSLE